MIIKSALKNYEVVFESDFDFVNNLLCIPNAFFVIDKNLYDLYKNIFNGIPANKIFIIEAVEENKTIEQALLICERMISFEAKRNAVLVSFGGGIVQDITGFAANILYRGIKWIFVPTTLLAASDSCIGGKTSLNHLSYKNLLGTFFPPDEIHICSTFFKTLLQRDFMSGLGEVVKFNTILGIEGIERLEKNIEKLLKMDTKIVQQFVETSLHFKKKYIEVDEFDQGIRVNLNFAHTFGHAYERSSSYGIPHGTAVALGTITANHISVLRKRMELKTAKRIDKLILKIIEIPMKNDWFNIEALILSIRKDKKQTGSEITAILMDNCFNLEIIHDLNKEEIGISVQYMTDLLRQKNII